MVRSKWLFPQRVQLWHQLKATDSKGEKARLRQEMHSQPVQVAVTGKYDEPYQRALKRFTVAVSAASAAHGGPQIGQATVHYTSALRQEPELHQLYHEELPKPSVCPACHRPLEQIEED